MFTSDTRMGVRLPLNNVNSSIVCQYYHQKIQWKTKSDLMLSIESFGFAAKHDLYLTSDVIKIVHAVISAFFDFVLGTNQRSSDE